MDASSSLSSGWNLLGLKSDSAKSITEFITGNEANITSIWKWKNETWAVYLPDGGTESFAESKGFNVISDIELGEGFWVNATQDVVLP